MSLNLSREKAVIEAILFLDSEPLDADALASISKLSKEVVLESIGQLSQRYALPDSGIEIVEIGGGFLLTPKSSLWGTLKPRYGKRNENVLSRAAMETLSIVAYSQPVTKTEVSTIRGVSAEGMLRLLQDKQLIRPVGRKDSPGKPVQYGTTREFLQAFRLGSIADLPRLDEINQERFELDDR